MQETLNDILARAAALRSRFEKLAGQLKGAATGLAKNGEPPSEDLLLSLGQARADFSRLCRELLQVSAGIPSAGIPGSPPSDLTRLEKEVRRLSRELDNQASQRRVAAVQEVLDKVQSLRHATGAAFTPLVEVIEKARELQRTIHASDSMTSSPAISELASGRHPLAQLATWVEGLNEIDDERWSSLEEAVSIAFGKSLAVAVARRRIVFSVGTTERGGIEVAPADPDREQVQEQSESGASAAQDVAPGTPAAPSPPDDEEEISDPAGEFTERASVPGEGAETAALPTHRPEMPTKGFAAVDAAPEVARGHTVKQDQAAPVEYLPLEQHLPAHEVASRLQSLSADQVPYGYHQLLWVLLKEGRAAFAWQISLHADESLAPVTPRIPTWLLRSLAVASRVRHSGGSLALDLLSSLDEYSSACFAARRSDWNEAVRLLLAGCCLRGSLLAPESGAPVILGELRFKDGLGQLYEFCQAIAEFGGRYQPLNPAALKGVRDLAAWERDSGTLRGQAEGWFSRAPQMTMAYAAATQVWKRWLEPGQLVHALVAPIIKDDLTALETVKNELVRIKEESVIRREINQTDQRTNKRRGPEITAKARAALVKHVREAVALAQRWVDLSESRPHEQSGPDLVQAEKLRDRLTLLKRGVLSELESLRERDLGLFLETGQRYCREAVEDVFRLFDPEFPVPGSEPELRTILGAELLRARAFRLSEDWMPEGASGDEVVNELVRLAREPVPDWMGAFEHFLNSGDHVRTDILLRYLEMGSHAAIDCAELAERRLLSIRNWQTHLKRQVADLRTHLEKAVAFGFLRESQRTRIVERIASVEQELPTMQDFAWAQSQLHLLRAEIDARQEEEVARTRERLTREKGRLDERVVQRVEGVLGTGDVLSANEYIDMALDGRELPEEAATQGVFDRFFPQGLRDLNAFLDRPIQGARSPDVELIQALRKKGGGTLGPLKLNNLPGMQAEQAADLLEKWFEAKRSKTLTTGQARVILRNIGFGNPVVPEVRFSAARVEWVTVEVTPLSDREFCPVAFFGSNARGRYRLRPIWTRPTEEDLTNLVGDLAHAPASIIFYFGRMTERVRRDLARLSRRRRRPFIVIDDAVIYYLCQERQARMRVMFDCTLPFTFVEPYSTTAGLVPPEMFYGRQRERAEILNPFGSCFIYGGRQLGKTALLRDVERTFHEPEKGQVALWLDLRTHGIGVERPVEDLWELLTSEFKRLQVLPSSVTAHQASADVLFKHLMSWLDKDTNRRILLLLDEADKFLDLDGRRGGGDPGKKGDFVLTGRLKGLMDRTNRRFKLVFAGLHNVQRTTRVENNPLAHYGEPICIGPLLDNLEFREARALVERPLGAIGYRFESQDLVTRILSQTNYYPSLIQLYCSHLLRHVLNVPFDPDKAPPFIITTQHVEDAYKSQELRKAIRDRFLWTLDLDPRYRVVALCLALYPESDNGVGGAGGHTVPWIRDQAMTFWAQGFRETPSEDAFRALLDEMVGLGVLRKEEGRYALRSLNVIAMLGSREEIESELLASTEQEPPLEYEPATFRKPYRSETGDVDLSRRSPLTALQLAELCPRRHGVSVVAGCRGTGLDDVLPFLEMAVGRQHVRADAMLLSMDDLMRHIETLSGDLDPGLTLFVVPAHCPWTMEWVLEARNAVHKIRARSGTLRVIFMAGPEEVWRLLETPSPESEVGAAEGVGIVSLAPWADSALRQWLDDCGFGAIDRTQRALVSKETGNWPGILGRFYERARINPHLWQRELDALPERLRQEGERESLLTEFGLDQQYRQKALRDLATVGEASREELAAVVDYVPKEGVLRIMRWGELLNLVQPSGGGHVHLDPTLAQLLMIDRGQGSAG